MATLYNYYEDYMTKNIPTVLVLCTGNSCRSQMAEVLLNHDLAGQVCALSAGTRPQAAWTGAVRHGMRRSAIRCGFQGRCP